MLGGRSILNNVTCLVKSLPACTHRPWMNTFSLPRIQNWHRRDKKMKQIIYQHLNSHSWQTNSSSFRFQPCFSYQKLFGNHTIIIDNIIISIIFVIAIPMILIMFVILWSNPSPVWSDVPKFGLQIWFIRTSSHIRCGHIFAWVTVYLIKIVEVCLIAIMWFGTNINNPWKLSFLDQSR